MSQEIIEGIRTIEREKGIEEGTLIAALEDALLAAYKKLPGSARHAEVILDDEGEFRVFAIDATKHTAVITVISKCLPQYRCPDTGFQRLVWVPQFEFIDGRWKIASLMYAFVLGEEFFTAGGEGSKIYLPNWEKFQ